MKLFKGHQVLEEKWRWFNKKSMQHVAVIKISAPDRAWVVTHGRTNSVHYRTARFSSLTAAFASLYPVEIESLQEALGVSPMAMLALTAEDDA